MSEDKIQVKKVRQYLREAEQELDTAVENGEIDHARYWLGQKRAFKRLLPSEDE